MQLLGVSLKYVGSSPYHRSTFIGMDEHFLTADRFQRNVSVFQVGHGGTIKVHGGQFVQHNLFQSGHICHEADGASCIILQRNLHDEEGVYGRYRWLQAFAGTRSHDSLRFRTAC